MKLAADTPASFTCARQPSRENDAQRRQTHKICNHRRRLCVIVEVAVVVLSIALHLLPLHLHPPATTALADLAITSYLRSLA
jgi:hypothetical protein